MESQDIKRVGTVVRELKVGDIMQQVKIINNKRRELVPRPKHEKAGSVASTPRSQVEPRRPSAPAPRSQVEPRRPSSTPTPQRPTGQGRSTPPARRG